MLVPSRPGQTAGQIQDIERIRIDQQIGAAKSLGLEVGQNRLLVLSDEIIRVAVAEPRVADLKVITRTQLLLTAKGIGTTDLTVWNRKDEPLVIALEVTRNLEPFRRQIKELFPNEDITASSAGDLVVLSGEVSDVRLPERLAELAKLHADKVANLVRVRGVQQVQLEVKFAEVSRSGMREMSFNIFHQDRLGRYVTGMAGASTLPGNFAAIPGTAIAGVPNVYAPNQPSTFSLFFSGLPKFPFSAMVSLLESNGLAKMLAEPTLVAMSGQEAKFLAGGEFPVPYSTGLGAVSVLWKKFGILLNFTPTVVDEQSIHLKMAAEVSDVDPARAAVIGGFSVPGLTSRQSETTVRLADGQSFAIAGLLSDRVRSQIDRVPFFGDLPVLGALFRSVDYRRDESELLVVVTARLARPLAPHEVPPLPTDQEINDPGDLNLFLLGSEGTGAPEKEEEPRQDKQQPETGKSTASPRRGPAGELGFIR
ncbi:MAG: type II and III secretion system protein family protein [Deltaproteobacteria bacterium]|nr:type II and III secretion system protein family protein [Deltaproteobacteria bacterium]